MTTELTENASDALLFFIGALEERLAYLYFVRSRGHAVADLELSDLKTEIFSLNPESEALDVFFELRARLAFLDFEENKQAIKALLYELNNISARMWQEPNHQRPHFHVNYKTEHNASYAVDTLIAAEESISGTAFFVKNRNGQICLITNRHVFDLNYKRTDKKYMRFRLEKVRITGKKPDESSGLPIHDQGVRVQRVRHNVLYSQVYENDIACIINPVVEHENSAGQFLVEWFITHDLIANREQLGSKLSVCDFVAFPGYPPWYDRLHSRPILRTGAISSDPRFDYSHSGVYDGECIAYEAFSFGGSSGSPVFAVQKGPRPGAGILFPGFRELMMIGINAGHLLGNHGVHSGISYMYKSSAILDIIDA